MRISSLQYTGHLSLPATLNEGDPVKAGHIIGHIGPWAYGVHLHFGVYQDRLNPKSGQLPFIDSKNGYGIRDGLRPDAETVDGVTAYGNWFDPISFIETRTFPSQGKPKQ